MCPGTTAYRRHTLKDQTDREEHCSTLVGLASALCQNIIPSFGIVFVFVFVLCLPKPRKRTCSTCGIRHELTLWCGDVVCGVVWCDVSGTAS
jgi:hypothetical protein